MPSSLEKLRADIINQNQERKNWAGHDTPYNLAKMIFTEAGELVESFEHDVDGSVFPIASELGDVGYLLIRLCAALDLDLTDAIDMKIKRNGEKYPADINSNGDYEGSIKLSKEIWSSGGGDVAFSHRYVEE